MKYCASACLMMLAQVPHDDVCFYRDAWIGVHSAPHPTSELTWERGKDWILKGYRQCEQ